MSLGLGCVVACGGSSGTSHGNGGDDEPSAGEGGSGTSGGSAGSSDGSGGDAGAASGGAVNTGGSTTSGGSAGASGASTGTSAGSAGDSGSGALGGTAGTSGDGGVSGAGATSGASGNLGVAGSPPDGCTQRKQQVGFASRRLFIAMDRSSSLLENADGTDVSIWDAVSSAFTGMVQDPASAELGVALRFFPHDQPTPGCSDPVCEFDACRDMLVPMGVLASTSGGSDSQEAALLGALMASAPDAEDIGGTPLHPALVGAFQAAVEYQANARDGRTTVVFVTDGRPNGCEEDSDALLDVAQGMLEQYGVGTYVIGLPGTSNDVALEHLAQFGGSVTPVYLPDGASLTADIESAFTYLRNAWSVCGFELPLQYAGSTLAYDTAFVSVRTYGGTPVAIPRLSAPADCGSAAGYTVEDTGARHQLEFCPATCEAARAPGALVEVFLDECPSTEP